MQKFLKDKKNFKKNTALKGFLLQVNKKIFNEKLIIWSGNFNLLHLP